MTKNINYILPWIFGFWNTSVPPRFQEKLSQPFDKSFRSSFPSTNCQGASKAYAETVPSSGTSVAFLPFWPPRGWKSRKMNEGGPLWKGKHFNTRFKWSSNIPTISFFICSVDMVGSSGVNCLPTIFFSVAFAVSLSGGRNALTSFEKPRFRGSLTLSFMFCHQESYFWITKMA